MALVTTSKRELKPVRSVNEFLLDYNDDSDDDEVIFNAELVLSPKRSRQNLRDLKDKDYSLPPFSKSTQKRLHHNYHSLRQ